MVTFNQVLPAAVRICEDTPGMVELEACCAVRDLRGRIRLVLKPSANPTIPVDMKALAASLKSELGAYFVEPIWSTAAAKPNEARFASEVFKHAQRWGDAAYEGSGEGQRSVLARAPWWKYERRLSRQEWLEPAKPTTPLWELGNGPGIVTFYSFKGGVGRTTALIACAWQLARAGKHVAIVDLDLEAPGLGAILGAETERGVVDFLVDCLATGSSDLTGLITSATALGTDGDFVRVVPAGTLNQLYLEKLGRLDFLGGQDGVDGSPIEQALRKLLSALTKLTPRPDYILIDSRAGLHDLAGLSLHRLAHVDVLVSRATEEGYRGLNLTVGTLAKRKGLAQLQCIMVHTLAPTEGLREAIAEEEEFLERSYQAFQSYVYLNEQSRTTTRDDPMAPHRPLVVRRDGRFDRFASIRSIESSFFETGFSRLRSHIEELCKIDGAAE